MLVVFSEAPPHPLVPGSSSPTEPLSSPLGALQHRRQQRRHLQQPSTSGSSGMMSSTSHDYQIVEHICALLDEAGALAVQIRGQNAGRRRAFAKEPFTGQTNCGMILKWLLARSEAVVV